LLNAFLGEKLAIVTPKPQTTRDRILGIVAVDGGQLVFLDTPGVHRGSRALNRHLSEVALSTIGDVDVVLFVIDAKYATRKQLAKDDRRIIEAIKKSDRRAIALINKVDSVPKGNLLPLIAQLSDAAVFTSIIPVSATQADGLDVVLSEVMTYLPESPPLYPEDELTDKPVRFLVSELIREQLFLSMKQELPYSVAVEIINYKEREDEKLIEIDATIHVERTSQKGIILGKGGQSIKEVCTAARAEIEKLVGKQVFLRTHVRVEPNWTKNERSMRKLGYSKSK
ncbi:MAG TPA: GTPase Era, partial [Myxococcales bacterium]|nr:GTPase Era [Myxococcales bacterium]